jgi:protein TonB
MHRRFLTPLIGLLAFPFFVAAAPAVAQDSNSSTPPSQKSGDVGANGLYKIGGDVSAPILIHSIAPKFPESARNAKVGGSVLVNLQVDTNGNPNHVRAIRGVGYNFDESAVDAVKQYRFKPAMKAGKPVPVQLNVEVNFKIF